MNKASPRDGSEDIFHSRLEFGPGGRHLLSVGWLWGPAGVARVFDAERALAEPSILDGGGEADALSPIADAEITGGCVLDDDRVVLATGAEDFGDSGSESAVGAREPATWSLSCGTWLGHARVDHPVGPR